MQQEITSTEAAEQFSVEELRDAWAILSQNDRFMGFKMLSRPDAEEFFFSASPRDQEELIFQLPAEERRSWIRLLPPDDAADLIQDTPQEDREKLLALLDDNTRKEVTALLAYAEDEAGGLMNPRFARVRPDMTVDEAISYLRKQALQHLETIYYVYVIDEQQRLKGVLSLRELFGSKPEKRVHEVMQTDLITVLEQMDQEATSRLFKEYDLVAVPVIDLEGRMKGIITVDDIVDVVEEEATEDIQKMGGTAVLDAPYLEIRFHQMLGKRAPWMAVLFIGEMLTASAMTYFEHEIARAVVLALFVPLIISSGGNSGSQASTLVIRAMALGELRLRDWWRVMRREFAVGFVLGSLLAVLGALRIIVWQHFQPLYGEHYMRVAVVVGVSLVGVVMLGTLAGSLLPFLLRRIGLDPASASAPFVATLVDVAGLVIYFTVASMVLTGFLL